MSGRKISFLSKHVLTPRLDSQTHRPPILFASHYAARRRKEQGWGNSVGPSAVAPPSNALFTGQRPIVGCENTSDSHGEGGAAIRLAPYLDLSLMPVDDPTGYGKAETETRASSSTRAHLVCTPETVEDMVKVLFSYANPGI